MKCTNCGASMERASTFCGYCGTAVTAASLAATAVMVQAASAPVAYAEPSFAQPAFAGMPVMAGQADASSARPTQFPDLPPYYQEAFAAIAAGGRSASKFNWAAFWFNCFWYLYRGMWVKSLCLLGLNVATGGVAGLFIGIYAGKYGNADLYQLRREGKQFW